MKKNQRLILASSSPRRQKILEDMGLEFDIIPSDFEEILDSDVFDYKKIENLAFQKAKSVANKVKEDFIILSADTVVILENKILGKPKDEAEAFLMLKKLSGKRHFVVTSACLLSREITKINSTTSFVEFSNLSDEIIKNYIEKFKPLDKAGAYGIQELPEGFVKQIEGSFENIIGLCPDAIRKMLNFC